jgi:hypothetical protein
MKILEDWEIEAIELKHVGGHTHSGRRTNNPEFLDMALGLEEGQSIVVLKSEWNGKSNPGTTLSSKAVRVQLKGRKYHCFSLKDNSGWLVAPHKTN